MSTATAPDPSKTHGGSTSAAESPHAHAKTKPADIASNDVFDPDSFRMTVGEHLEELRGRLILALGGLCVAVLACLLFSERIMVFFCAPLTHQLDIHHIAPQVFYSNLTDPFMTYLKVTMIVAAAIAGPWMIFQAWQFVAAGLYPNERKMVTRYIPLSVTLFVTGLLFVYFLVLPLSIRFFIEFSNALHPSLEKPDTVFVESTVRSMIPALKGDLKDPHIGDAWINLRQGKMKIVLPIPGDENTAHYEIRSVTFSPESMMIPIITIGDYIDLVLTFMVTFGIAFQLPLVMLALVSVGIVDVTFLKEKRRVIFFGMAIAAAFLAPGDIVTSMLALLIPLVGLYEFGLILVKMSERRRARENAAPI